VNDTDLERIGQKTLGLEAPIVGRKEGEKKTVTSLVMNSKEMGTEEEEEEKHQAFLFPSVGDE